MTIGFPNSLDTFTDPTGSDLMSVVDHALQHDNTNGAIRAIEAKIGVNESAVRTSLDYITAAAQTTIYNVMQFGAAGDGITDDTAAIQEAIDAAAAADGGIVLLPPLQFNISSTLNLIVSNVHLQGSGGDTTHDTPSPTTGTIINWAGAVGGTVISMRSPSGALLAAQCRMAVHNLTIECGNSAAVGLEILSARSCDVKDVFIHNPTTMAVSLGVVASLAESRDTQHNHIRNVTIRLYGTPSADGIVFDGDALSNTSLNVITNVFVLHQDGTAYKLANADNNVFVGCRCFRKSGGNGDGVALLGGASLVQTARSNMFIHLTAGDGGIHSYGTETYTSPSLDNMILGYDTGNSAFPPTVGTGSRLSYSYVHGQAVNASPIASTNSQTGALVLANGGLGVGGQVSAQSNVVLGNDLDIVNNSRSAFPTAFTRAKLFKSLGTGSSYPFLGDGNLVIQTGDDANHDIILAGGVMPAVIARFIAASGDMQLDAGNVIAGAAGKGFQAKEGSNAKQGTATLSAGSATVANTNITANSRILLTAQSLGTVSAPKAIAVTARIPGTSFTITSSDNTDTSIVAYEIFEPAP